MFLVVLVLVFAAPIAGQVLVSLPGVAPHSFEKGEEVSISVFLASCMDLELAISATCGDTGEYYIGQALTPLCYYVFILRIQL